MWENLYIVDSYFFIMIRYISYFIAVISSIIIALLLGVPLLGEKPLRRSWTLTAIFPTPIIALGLLAICIKLGIRGFYDTIDLSLFIGILSALMVKYFFEDIFPQPPREDSYE